MIIVVALSFAAEAQAEERWALVLSGASGGAKYAEQMGEWRTALTSALVDRYGFTADKVRVFVDETIKTGEPGTAANVRRAIGELRKQMTREDLLLIILLGHGSYDGDTAKFNLVGPDLTATDWAGLLNGVPGRLVVVNTTAASFPFLERLAGQNRIVITATDSAAQKYATVFPDYFAKAMREASSDLDKNGRTSIFEVFAATSAAVKQHYEQRGQLTTERAVFDDNGDGVGRESEAPGPDGSLARLLYLDAESPAAANNPELAALIRRRRELEAEAEALKLKKAVMPATAWTAEYEKLMIELAKVSREIRTKS
ncbi:MAG: hypothetical protein ACRD1H_14970 [Vicinamibacterales bacterium]